MNAATHIEFIQPHKGRTSHEIVQPNPELAMNYKAMLYRMLMKNNEYIRVMALEYDTGETEDCFEMIFKIEDTSDGSYLYIVVYGNNFYTQQDMDIRVNISEHDREGMTRKSFSYVERDDVVIRVDNEDKELLGSYHFSHLDLMETYAELLESRQSEWDAVREHAAEAFATPENMHINSELEAQFLLNNLPIDQNELDKLSALLAMAEPIAQE